jgi:hypothetical protein
MFQLHKNHRSHEGIVNLANSITQLILRYWPNMIDKLDRETGQVKGVKPVFLVGSRSDATRYERALFGDPKKSVLILSNEDVTN